LCITAKPPQPNLRALLVGNDYGAAKICGYLNTAQSNLCGFGLRKF
jgi:hypothetical protein